MPNVDKEKIIGVRTPALRKLAKELAKDKNVEAFLSELPHEYYDENNLHGFIISECKDYDKTISYLDKFLPYVDNWATCDLLSPKIFRKNIDKLEAEIDRWIGSSETFTVRFGIEMAMAYFLDGDFEEKWLEKVAGVKSDEYYVKMMIAWFFATALTKQWNVAIKVVESKKLDKWVQNKTIQKARESFRVLDEHKAYLKTLKV